MNLRQVPMFATLVPEELRMLEQLAVARQVPAGEVIVRQGEAGDSMFLIGSGQVRVVSDVPSERVLLAHLGPGEFFGEMSLLTGAERTAAVVADRPTSLVELSRAAIERLEERRPGVIARLQEIATRRGAGDGRVFQNEASSLVALSSAHDRLVAGSGEADDLPVQGPGVLPRHAIFERQGDAWMVRRGARDAALYVNREPVEEAPLADGDVITIGSRRLFLLDGVLKLFEQSRGMRVEVRGLSFDASGRQILEDVSLAIYPGELVAIVGPSGAGKTTFLNALLGIVPAEGEILYDGLSLRHDPQRIALMLGYVPQQDTIHGELTVRQSLGFAGHLRLRETSEAELDERVSGVLARVHLEHRADTRVESLSGGQRKRACVAAELLSDPGIVFLDEPTSGLDPGLDEDLMFQLRELADEGRTVVLTTHATRNIRMCDRVIVLHGGRLAFAGAPSEALAHFGVDDAAEVYRRLHDEDPAEAAARFAGSPLGSAVDEAALAPEGAATRAGVGAVGQTWHLIRRDLRVLARDRVNMVLRVAGAPALAVLQLATFDKQIFHLSRADGGNAQQAMTLLYLASAICLFLGAFTCANVITRENSIFRRERLVGLSPTAYVAAKVLVLGAFSVLQGVLFVAMLTIGIDFPDSPATEIRVAGALILTSLAGVTMGLFISALSPNADRAAILVVLALIPQLIFAGSTVPRSEMGLFSKAVSDLTVTKWALELEGIATGMDARFDAQSTIRAATPGGSEIAVRVPYRPYEHAFEGEAGWRWLALAGFVVVFTTGTWLAQRRKAP